MIHHVEIEKTPNLVGIARKLMVDVPGAEPGDRWWIDTPNSSWAPSNPRWIWERASCE